MPSEPRQFPPLALDREDSQPLPEVAAAAWLVKRMTRGRPRLVTRGGDPIVLDLYALIEDLEKAVQFEAGHYRLYPVDEDRHELASRVAHIETSDGN